MPQMFFSPYEEETFIKVGSKTHQNKRWRIFQIHLRVLTKFDNLEKSSRKVVSSEHDFELLSYLYEVINEAPSDVNTSEEGSTYPR